MLRRENGIVILLKIFWEPQTTLIAPAQAIVDDLLASI